VDCGSVNVWIRLIQTLPLVPCSTSNSKYSTRTTQSINFNLRFRSKISNEFRIIYFKTFSCSIKSSLADSPISPEFYPEDGDRVSPSNVITSVHFDASVSPTRLYWILNIVAAKTWSLFRTSNTHKNKKYSRKFTFQTFYIYLFWKNRRWTKSRTTLGALYPMQESVELK
jgi:hypothetical protein